MVLPAENDEGEIIDLANVIVKEAISGAKGKRTYLVKRPRIESSQVSSDLPSPLNIPNAPHPTTSSISIPSPVHEPSHDTDIFDTPTYSPPPSNNPPETITTNSPSPPHTVQTITHQETQITITEQITTLQQPPTHSSPPHSLQKATFDYDFEPGFLIPSPPPDQRPLMAPLAQGCSESPEAILRKWPVVSLELPDSPEPKEYDMAVFRIFNKNAPIIPMQPTESLKHCMNRIVIPSWDTIVKPRLALTFLEQQARANRHSSLIPGGSKITWKQGVHPYEFGNLLNDQDFHFFSTLETEKFTPIDHRRMFPWFTPFIWTKMFEGTNVSIVPDRQCPQLPLVESHKNKELKVRRKKSAKLIRPPSSKQMFHLTVSEIRQEMQTMLNLIKEGNEMTEDDATYFWQLHLQRYSLEACSSGLSAADKAADCKIVRGHMGFSQPRYVGLSTGFQAPISSRFVEEPKIEWLPFVEEVLSEEEVAEEKTDMEIEEQAAENLSAQIEQASSSTTSSQPMALQVIEPASSQPDSSKSLSSDEIASLIDSRIARLDESYQKQLADHKQFYENKLEATISPLASVIYNMNSMLTGLFQATPQLLNFANPTPPPPNDPRPPTPPPPPPQS